MDNREDEDDHYMFDFLNLQDDVEFGEYNLVSTEYIRMNDLVPLQILPLHEVTLVLLNVHYNVVLN